MRSRLPGVLPVALLACLGMLGIVFLAPAVLASDPDVGPVPILHGIHNDTSTPFNLVDLASLADHDFDGHGFEVGQVLGYGPGWSERAVSYVGDGLRITGTLTLQRSAKPAPVVVAMHGFIDPRVYTRGSGLVREERRLAEEGYVVFHPDYRNYAGSSREKASLVDHPLGYPADVINGILALQKAKLPGVDTSRIGLLGRSMGGGVALDVAVARPDLVDALLLYSPVSSDARQVFERFVRGPLRTRVASSYDETVWGAASAVNHLDRIDVPVQIHHGTADVICPLDWSGQTTSALKLAGKDVSLVRYRGAQHRFDRQWPLFMDRAIAFFGSTLR